MRTLLIVVLLLALPALAFAFNDIVTRESMSTRQLSTTTQIAPTQVTVDTTATGTTVYAGAATTCRVTVQNVCTVAVTCGHGNVTSGGPGMVLFPMSGAGAYDGAAWTPLNGAAIKCIAAAGSCLVNVQPEACP